MEFKKFNNDYVIRMDPGDEVVSTLKEICQKENIRLASVSALGATNDCDLGAYDIVNKVYEMNTYQFPAEITSLIGNVTRQEDEVYLHLHMNIADTKGNAFGGHLNRAVISVTCEMFLHVLDGEVNRQKDPVTGLNILKF